MFSKLRYSRHWVLEGSSFWSQISRFGKLVLMFLRWERSVEYVWPQNTYIQWALKNWRYHIKFSVCPISHFFLSYAVAVIVGHAVFYSPSMLSYWRCHREATVRYWIWNLLFFYLRLEAPFRWSENRKLDIIVMPWTGWRLEAVSFKYICLLLVFILTTDSAECYDNKSSN